MGSRGENEVVNSMIEHVKVFIREILCSGFSQTSRKPDFLGEGSNTYSDLCI